MNYRLLVRWRFTEEVVVELFEKAEYADTIIRYLDRALENGAKLGFELQHRNENGETETIDYGGDSIGEWTNLLWD